MPRTASLARIPWPTIFLAAAGLSWTGGQAVLPDMALDTADRYDLVAAARGAEALSAALLILAGWFLVLGALALARRPRTEGRGSRLLAVGTGMLAVGGIWLAAGRGVFNMLFLRVTAPAVPRDTAIAILDAPGGVEFAPLLLTLPALVFGPVLLAIGMRRAGRASWLPLILWVVGIGTFLASEFSFKLGEITGIALASVALALLGRAASRPSADEPAATDLPVVHASRG